jgi:hypothetical protein
MSIPPKPTHYKPTCQSSSQLKTALRTTSQRTRLPLAIAGLLLTAQAQAFLPTPLSVVTTGALSNANDATALQNADTEQLLATWRKQAQADTLAQHTTWRRLLYFLDDKKSLFGKGKSQSLVDNKAFFLSADGRQDSAAELDAMLVALAQEMTISDANKINNSNGNTRTVSDSSVLCRFPARVQWLKESLKIDDERLQVACPALDKWMEKLAPEQLSVMFAQEHLDNPLSAFAHTLLRIDSPASAKDSSQIHHAYALNDTVDGNPDDSFVIYAIKSMSGKYNNIIEIDPYPEKFAKYLKDD